MFCGSLSEGVYTLATTALAATLDKTTIPPTAVPTTGIPAATIGVAFGAVLATAGGTAATYTAHYIDVANAIERSRGGTGRR